MSAVSSRPPAANRIGSTVDDKYVLVRTLGSGASGVVFEAEQRGVGKRVALKLMHEPLTAEARERFLADAVACARIAHPGVIDVVDFGVTAERRGYLVMELASGPTLERALSGAALSPAEASDLALAVLHALAAAHGRGVVHRNLCPSNVLVDRRAGSVKLIDFAIGHDHVVADHAGESDAVENPSAGTRFCAPERLSGDPPDERMDVYSVGAMLYEMLAALPVPSGERRDERSVHDVNPAVPVELARVVARALETKRESRFGAAYDFAVALEPFASRVGRALLRTFPGHVDDLGAVVRTRVDGRAFGTFNQDNLSEPAIPRQPSVPNFDELGLGSPDRPRVPAAAKASHRAVSKPRRTLWLEAAGRGALFGALLGSGLGVLIAWWVGLL